MSVSSSRLTGSVSMGLYVGSLKRTVLINCSGKEIVDTESETPAGRSVPVDMDTGIPPSIAARLLATKTRRATETRATLDL